MDGPIAPLSPQSQSQADPPAYVAKPLTPQSASFQAAPVPNPDVNAPADTTKPDTTLGPKFMSPKAIFQGDGYSYASSEQSTLDGRRLAAAGLGLNVPLSSDK